jgi:pectate lyase
MDDFEAGLTSKWDFGTGAPPATTMDGTKVLSLTEAAGDQRLGAAGMLTWTNYSVEAKVKVLSFSGTSSSDGVAICARLSGPESFYYLLISPSDTKALKIKINNSGNSSLSSSLDSTGFALNTWVTLRLDVQGPTLTASLNGAIKGTYTATGADILPMGGIGLMVQRANVEFDDVTVRALP